jgi:hypothetical protein
MIDTQQYIKLNIRGEISITKYRCTNLVEDDTNQRRKDWTWYFHYCKYYITGNTSIVNITILVLTVNAAGCFILSPEDYAMLYVIVVDCIK